MKVYTAIWKDGYSDTTAHVFSDPNIAIEWAIKTARKYDRFGEYKEADYEGWLFHAQYSCEGDCIYVVESDLDGDV